METEIVAGKEEATVIRGIPVAEFGEVEGLHYLTVEMGTETYDEYRKRPFAIEFRGMYFEKTGWSRDSHRIYYAERSERKNLAKKADMK